MLAMAIGFPGNLRELSDRTITNYIDGGLFGTRDGS